jgi:hypothetical protein
MNQVLSLVDRLLRGQVVGPEQLATGKLDVSEGDLAKASLALGASYGAFMGLYAALQGGAGGALQLVSSAVKVPLLFLLTLAVTLPSLYVFSALARSPLGFRETLRLLLAAITVNLALLASFGPITGFFTLSTDSYPFMKLLSVAFFTAGGLVGLRFLREALSALLPKSDGDKAEHARAVFRVWTVIYAVVGAQMGWILRPFVGNPGLPFQLFREREKNFFQAVLETLGALLS